MKKYWCLWAGDGRQKTLALGPYETREQVDSMEMSFRDFARDNIKGFHPWVEQGNGRFNKYMGQ